MLEEQEIVITDERAVNSIKDGRRQTIKYWWKREFKENDDIFTPNQ
ncbi:MAG: hypothetical protein ACTSX6_13720 [Candidatus Heimdallarchaeaceae archaeon]